MANIERYSEVQAPESRGAHKFSPFRDVSGNASVSSCAKAIVCGEHAVLYGAPAVSMPLMNQRMTFHASKCENLEREQLLFGKKPVSSHVQGIVKDAFRLLSVPYQALKISGVSDIPIGSGLGSSAAICVAILKLIAGIFGKSLEREILSEAARELEGRFHGKSSGLDTATVAWEQMLLFRTGEKPKEISVRSWDHKGPLRFALIDSGIRSSTISMVKKAEPWFTDKKEGEGRVAKFEALSIQCATALETGDLAGLADAMNQNHRYLNESGVSNSTLESLRVEIMKSGALASKITGAGGGGCVLALLAPEGYKNQLKLLSDEFGKERVFFV